MIPSISVLPSQASGAKGPRCRSHSAQADHYYGKEEQIPITIDGGEIGIVVERASKSTVRVTEIAHSLYPTIRGPKNANAVRLEKEEGFRNEEVSFRIPPRAALPSTRKVTPADADDRATDSSDSDSGMPKECERDPAIMLSGEREAVQRVVVEIKCRVAKIKSMYLTLNIDTPKRQHRFRAAPPH
ncbi:hypothetical protein A4X13_0g7314 [Tilletia indica]|uniref:Uncharacterized protein n=1 Tax=Tilletia indica TaxID=43049 RepID=A0A8T8SKH8_9BASI|nr:hypothetical protein A4X13_0g7314 [Tilletia indica]